MKKLLLASSAILLTFSSCYRAIYKPETVHDPMLSKQGEFSGTGSILFVGYDNIPSYDVGVGYSPIKGLGVKAAVRGRSASFGTTTDKNGTYTDKLNGYTFEGGVGYYNRFEQSGFFSVYLNYAMGKNEVNSVYDTSGKINSFIHSKFNAISIQPAIGSVKRRSSMVGGVRVSVYRFHELNGYNYNFPSTQLRNMQTVYYPIIEPYYNFEVGSPSVRFHLQTGFSYSPNGPDVEGFKFTPKLAVGLTVRFGNRK